MMKMGNCQLLHRNINRHFILTILLMISISIFSGFYPQTSHLIAQSNTDKPNILWLTTQDHGPHLGIYGDPYAHTPAMDSFAEEVVDPNLPDRPNDYVHRLVSDIIGNDENWIRIIRYGKSWRFCFPMKMNEFSDNQVIFLAKYFSSFYIIKNAIDQL